MLLGNVSEMSLILLCWNLLVSDVALGLGTLVKTLLRFCVPKWPLHFQFSFKIHRLVLLFLHKTALLLMSRT